MRVEKVNTVLMMAYGSAVACVICQVREAVSKLLFYFYGMIKIWDYM